MKKFYFSKSVLFIGTLLLVITSCNDSYFDDNDSLFNNKSSDGEVVGILKDSIHFDLKKNQSSALKSDNSHESMKETLRALGASESVISNLFNQLKEETIKLGSNANSKNYVELNSMKQLEDLGITKDYLVSKTTFSGTKPDGILISGKGIYGKVNSGMYGYFGNQKLYLVASTNAKVLKHFETIYSNMVVKTITNDSNKEQTGSFSYSYSTTKSVSYTQSHSVGTKFGYELEKKINLGIVSGTTKFSAELSYNYTNTQGTASSETKTKTSTANYTIPPKSKMNIVFLFPEKKGKVKYYLPVIFEGRIATNYGKKVSSPNDGSRRYFISVDFNEKIIKPKYGNNFSTRELDVEYKDENTPDILYLAAQSL